VHPRTDALDLLVVDSQTDIDRPRRADSFAVMSVGNHPSRPVRSLPRTPPECSIAPHAGLGILSGRRRIMRAVVLRMIYFLLDRR
jgi:hypothetical protein